MVKTYSLSDISRAVASKPFGWPRFEIGDLYPGRPVPQQSERTRRRKFCNWMDRNRYYNALGGLAYVAGTTWTWSDSAGTPTFNCTLQNLASGSAREGAKSTTTLLTPPNNLTNVVPPIYWALQLTVTFAAAPTNQQEVQVYLSFATSSSSWNGSGGTSGSDAAYSNTDAALSQMILAGSLITSNAEGTAAQVQEPFTVVNADPSNRIYVTPVIYNTTGTGQNLKNAANTSTLSMIPYYYQSSN